MHAGSSTPGLAAFLTGIGLVLMGCTGTSSPPQVTGSTTISTSTTSTTTSTTTTSTTLATSTTSGEALSSASPLAHLDSFHGTANITMSAPDGSELTVSSEGLYSSGDFQCTNTVDIGPISVSSALISIDGQVWIDSGSGVFVEIPPGEAAVIDEASGCPATAVFWESFDLGPDLEGVSGVEDEKNDIPSQRFEISELLSSLGGLGIGIAELEGMTFDQFILWLADPDGWLVAMEMDATVESSVLEAQVGPLFDPGTEIHFLMNIDIDRPNDPTIVITAP